MNTIVVLSACICRPTVHERCFGRLLELLKGCAVRFVVNIDPVSGADGCSQEDTRNALNALICSYGHPAEFFEPKSSCFFEATRRLLKRGEDILDETSCILWFEDDKFFRRDPRFVNIMKHNCANDVHHFWKKSAGCPTFHPCLWGYTAAKRYLFPAFYSAARWDPELTMMAYWKKHYKGELNVHYYKTFTEDVGRIWQAANGLTKWVRERAGTSCVTYPTLAYSDGLQPENILGSSG